MILVSGATGRVGTATCKALVDAGVPFRAYVRSPEKFAFADVPNAQVVTGELTNRGALSSAMQGVEKALLVTGNNPDQAEIERQFTDCAAQAGVSHLVKVSSMEASPQVQAALPKLHFESEQHIRSTGIEWTFLRPNFFMQNLMMYAASIRNAGVFALPLGGAKTAMIDARDVGAVAAAVLTGDGHGNRIYELTGPDLLDFDEVAAVLSGVLGKPVSYVRQSHDEFRAVLAQFIHAQWHLDAVCELFKEIAGGSLEKITGDVGAILGRPPLALLEYVRSMAKAFQD